VSARWEVHVFKTLGLSLIMGLLVSSYPVFGQIATSGQQRIPQPIIINGQQAQGVMVVQNGTVQSYTCPSPQQYVTADQSSSGWACYEETTGVWLLHAQPPSQTASPRPLTRTRNLRFTFRHHPFRSTVIRRLLTIPTATIRPIRTTIPITIRFSSARDLDLASASGFARLSS
jgi:hypothetical protein